MVGALHVSFVKNCSFMKICTFFIQLKRVYFSLARIIPWYWKVHEGIHIEYLKIHSLLIQTIETFLYEFILWRLLWMNWCYVYLNSICLMEFNQSFSTQQTIHAKFNFLFVSEWDIHIGIKRRCSTENERTHAHKTDAKFKPNCNGYQTKYDRQ